MQPDFKTNLSREIERATDALLQLDWSDNRTYAGWLAQTYHFVSHTGRFICRAAGAFSLADQEFYKLMTAHSREEEDHEIMAKTDIERMGFRLSEFPEWSITKVFRQNLVHEIEAESPFCLFGRIYFLEGLACAAGPEILDRLKAETKLKSSSFLKLHAEEDQHHHAESLKLLSKMTPEQIRQVQSGFETTVAIYTALTQKLVNAAAQANRAKVA